MCWVIPGFCDTEPLPFEEFVGEQSEQPLNSGEGGSHSLGPPVVPFLSFSPLFRGRVPLLR